MDDWKINQNFHFNKFHSLPVILLIQTVRNYMDNIMISMCAIYLLLDTWIILYQINSYLRGDSCEKGCPPTESVKWVCMYLITYTIHMLTGLSGKANLVNGLLRTQSGVDSGSKLGVNDNGKGLGWNGLFGLVATSARCSNLLLSLESLVLSLNSITLGLMVSCGMDFDLDVRRLNSGFGGGCMRWSKTDDKKTVNIIALLS